MSNLLFGAALGGAIGHFAAKEGLKYAAFGVVGALVWDFASEYVGSAVHSPRLTRASVPPPRPLNKHVTGAVHRGGFRGGSQMPLGPGPWPTQGASPPDSNMQSPDPNDARNDPGAMMTGSVGAAPYGRGYFEQGEWW